MSQWFDFDDADGVAAAGAEFIAQCATAAIARHGQFRLVLAGGTTPLACYRLLAGQPHDWQRWRLFYGDERCLPEEHDQRNHRMVMQTGLAERVGQHHVMPAELGPEAGARAYRSVINDALPFDLVLLGMGEDGHTASLFPGHELDMDDALCMPVYDSPKPPAERISLTRLALQDCADMLLLVTGDGKRQAVHQWIAGDDLPVARVTAIPQARIYIEKNLLGG